MSDLTDPPTDSNALPSDEEARRLLELELQKTRSEASAARLEARAAEIELMMRRYRQSDSAQSRSDLAHPPARRPAFANWNEVRAAQLQSATSGANSFSISRASAASGPSSVGVVASEPVTSELVTSEPVTSEPVTSEPVTSKPSAEADQESLRFDGKHNGNIKRPHFLDRSSSSEEKITAPAVVQSSLAAFAVETDHPPAEKISLSDAEIAEQLSDDWEDQIEDAQPQRRRPAAPSISAAVHVGLLLLLAAVGLRTHQPKDQVALSASAAEANEVSMETFSIETTELQNEPEISEPTPSETEYEISPIGELQASDFVSDAITGPPAPMAASMASTASAATMTLKSDAKSKMEFCGVEGGGNHFVYLVDSSGSMREGFESARQALLASIDLLTPDQRFYVVFFDTEPDYMRINNPSVDEPRSVYATPENKAALRRWAMRIKQDRGRAPYDPLRFALELKPDVIFLLSDGEFPESIFEILKEENRIENLFGESKPISIVHTIGYFSEEGASIMRRIAQQNNGQYRYVPKP